MHMFWQTIDMAHCVGLGSIWISFPYLPEPCTSVTYNVNYNISNWIHMLFRSTVSWLFNHSNNKLGKRYWHIKVLDLIADLLKCTVLNCLQFVLNVLDSPYQGHLANACKNILPCEGLTFLQFSQIYVLVCQQVWFDKHCNSL